MSNDLFSEVEVTNSDSDVNHLEALVGDGKKFKSVEDLAKGKAEADRYIENLTSKLDELKKDLEQRQSMAEYLDQIRGQAKPDPVSHQVDPNQVPPAANSSDLEKTLEELLARREQQKAHESNMDRVKRVLNENFQDQANIAINHKAQQLGMSVKKLQELAADAPSAFFNLMGIQEDTSRTPSGIPAPRTSVNSTGNQPAGQVRNAAYYEKMKQTNPKQYFDPKTTVQQMRDRAALGDKYYN